MTAQVTACVLFLALAVSACDSPGQPSLAPALAPAQGHQESFLHRTTIERAVGQANRILGSRVAPRLYPSWRAREAGLYPVWEADGALSFTLAVPVYAVDGDLLPAEHIVFVPTGEPSIIVNADRLSALFKMFAGPKGEGLAIDETALLAFSLLHEAGHLHHGDVSHFVEAAPGMVRDLLAVELTLKDIQAGRVATLNRELRADVFALEHVRAAFKDGERLMDAGSVMGMLTAAEFNLAMERVLGGFGMTGSRRRERFRDASYTHPNMELRMMVLLHLNQPTPTTEALLRSFLEERARPVEPASGATGGPTLLPGLLLGQDG